MKSLIIFSMLFLSGCAQIEAVTKRIGPLGGKIEIGKANIVFPDGALSNETSIVIKKLKRLPAKLPKEEVLGGDLFKIEPEGKVFKKPTKITLPCNEKLISRKTGANDHYVYVAYYNGEGWIKVGGSIVDEENNTVSALISHSGEYCVVCRKKAYGITSHPYKEGEIPVLLVHDILSPSQSFNLLMKYLKKECPHPIWIFEYPCDQPIERSAELLSQELTELHKKHGDFKLNIVGYGVGGLVSSYYMLNDTTYHNDVEKELITIATPNNGSQLATYEDVLSLTERIEKAGLKLTQQDINILFSFSDALGETGEQIQTKEGNLFFEKLEALNNEYRRKMATYDKEKGPPLEIQIECFSCNKPYAFSEDFGLILRDIEELRDGDTYVSVRSTMLSPLENNPFHVHHYEVLNDEAVFQDLVGYLEFKPFSWPELIKNIGKPGGLDKIAETWEQRFKLEQGTPVNFKIILEFARNLLNSCEPDGILLTNGDNDTFPLWWVQVKEGFRKDVTVANLPLLNTTGFIKYLKGKPHQLPISLSEEEIDSLKPIKKGDNLIWISYQVVDEIIKTNKWKRPIYYAVTVSDRYVKHPHKFEGLVQRIVETEGEKVDIEKCLKNVHEVYNFKEVFDEQGNLVEGIDCVMKGLMTNHSAMYFVVGMELKKKGEKDKVDKEFEMALKFAEGKPDVIVPIGKEYEDIGEIGRAEALYKGAIEVDPTFFKTYEALAELYNKTNRKTEAIRLLSQWVQRYPDDKEAIKLLGSYGE